MNRAEFIREITDNLRDRNIRKPVSIPKQVFHISDDDGNTRDFSIKKIDKTVIFTIDDVESILDAAEAVLRSAIQNGDKIAIRGIGTLGVKYRKARELTNVCDGEKVIAEDRYVPKFWPGTELKMAAKIYGLKMRDVNADDRIVYDNDEEADE